MPEPPIPSDVFFGRWEQTYPEPLRSGFHRDGVIDPATFAKETDRVLFVLLEPNSRRGAYDKYYGADLRELFRDPFPKQMTRSLGLWTRYLLDGDDTFESLTAEQSCAQLRRAAVMNLKKLAGTGTADIMRIGQYGWRDRAFSREQVRMIAPTIIVTCGAHANGLFAQVMADDLEAQAPDDLCWTAEGQRVLPGNHPSLRPRHAEDALRRLVLRHAEK